MHEVVGYAKKGFGLLESGKEVIGGVKGDIVLLAPAKKSPHQIEKIVTSSPLRIEKICPHAPYCGGCSWQEMQYEAQLQEKEARLKLLFPGEEIAPITPSPEQKGFRGKMEFTFSKDRKGHFYLGLILAGSRGWVENVSACQVMPAWGNTILDRVRLWWQESGLDAYYGPKDRGHLRTLTLRSGKRGSKMVILTVSGNPLYSLERAHIESFTKEAFLDENTSVYLVIQQTIPKQPTQFYEMHLKGPEYLEEELLGQTFFISPLAFFQPNPLVAEKMFLKVKELLAVTGKEKILDLYCGMGTIGALLAPYVRQVVGVELNARSIVDAKAHVERLGLDNVSLWQGDVQEFLEKKLPFFQPDIVIVDPPRSGLTPKTLALLPLLQAKKIVYVSCNPTTQAKDLEILTQTYQIEGIYPFDAFPHTPHIENIILLTRTTTV
jgi:23S rRNA (uracil1939-C5)-methyltransferase